MNIKLSEGSRGIITVIIAFFVLVYGWLFAEGIYRWIVEPDFIVYAEFRMPKDGGDRLVLLRNEWNGAKKYPLQVVNHRWMWQSPDGKWNDIRIPYDHQDRLKKTADTIVLTSNGQVYLRTGDESSDKGMTKWRMSYREGSWCYWDREAEGNDKWVPLDSRYEY